MQIYWSNDRKDLVAQIDCRTGKRQLEGGSLGWYEVSNPFVPWLLGWKLRIQISIVERGPADGQYQNGPQRFRFREFLFAHVEHDIISVTFQIPDCIYPFNGSGCGCAEGNHIRLASGTYHCQARIEARPPVDTPYRWTLTRTEEDDKSGINLLRSGTTERRLEDLQHITRERAKEVMVQETGDVDLVLVELVLRKMSEEEARAYLRKKKLEAKQNEI